MDGLNYYQLFSLTPDGDLSDLKSRYRRLSLEHHPDRGGSVETMAHINEAYRTLSNPLLRREYDRQLERAAQVTVDDYHYTRPQPAARRPSYASAAAQPMAEEHDSSSFWRWFIALVIMGLALIIYDVMSTVIMPSLVRESSASATSDTTSSSTQDLSGFANSALNEMQGGTSSQSATQQTSPATIYPDTSSDNSSSSSDQSTTTSPSASQQNLRELRRSWRDRL